METDEIKEKFEEELKWGSYYFLYSIILSSKSNDITYLSNSSKLSFISFFITFPPKEKMIPKDD